MSFSQETLEQLAAHYTDACNSKVPESVANCYVPTSRIVINRGKPTVSHEQLTAMAVEFHADVPDVVLKCDAIWSAGDHMVYLWTITGHHADTVNPFKVGDWENRSD